MTSFRIKRINKQLQREIALLLEYRVKNEIVKSAIITGVECTRDLQQANVFFTTVSEQNRENVLKELQQLGGSLRSILGKNLHLKQIPELHFRLDTSEDYGRHIDQLLDRIHDKQTFNENEE